MSDAPTLADYGGRMIETDGRPTVEMVDPNDNARARHQYRRVGDAIEHRVLLADGSSDHEGSPWRLRDAREMARLRSVRGEYSPILDPLGL